MTDQLLTIQQAAAHLGRPVATLYDWRYRSVGPRSAKLRGRVVYRQSDLEAWVEAQFATAVGDDLAARPVTAGGSEAKDSSV